jgi:hypothetical protein
MNASNALRHEPIRPAAALSMVTRANFPCGVVEVEFFG